MIITCESHHISIEHISIVLNRQVKIAQSVYHRTIDRYIICEIDSVNIKNVYTESEWQGRQCRWCLGIANQ